MRISADPVVASTSRAVNDGWGNVEIFSSIENLEGGDRDDTLTGDGGRNILTGGEGSDTLDGRGSDDIYDGGADPDTFLNCETVIEP